MADVALEVLEAVDALVRSPQHCEEGRSAFVLVRRIRGLRLVLPEQSQMLVWADLLQVGGHGLAEREAVQRVVRPSSELTPDRTLDLHDSLGKTYPDVIRSRARPIISALVGMAEEHKLLAAPGAPNYASSQSSLTLSQR